MINIHCEKLSTRSLTKHQGLTNEACVVNIISVTDLKIIEVNMALYSLAERNSQMLLDIG